MNNNCYLKYNVNDEIIIGTVHVYLKKIIFTFYGISKLILIDINLP